MRNPINSGGFRHIHNLKVQNIADISDHQKKKCMTQSVLVFLWLGVRLNEIDWLDEDD